MKKQKVTILKEAVEWYSQNRKIYNELCHKVHNIIFDLLDFNNVNIHAIFSRTKEIESFQKKIDDPRYDNPKEQITDLAGIRIICYVESDLKVINKIIEENFKIDNENSLDKSKLLGTDKVGYKSIHYVAQLKNDRIVLPEYKKFKNRKFEIQIRTILQHAWAEIEHDRNYKFTGELPDNIKRRFKLIAGTLELADREFDSIANEIDIINSQVEKGTKEGKLDFEINTTTLKQFLITKFDNLIPKYIQPTFTDVDSEYEILQELNDFGLNTLNELNNIIPSDYEEAVIEFPDDDGSPSNFLGTIRNLMIINDWKKYFEKSYKRDWQGLSSADLLEHYNVPMDNLYQILLN